jgi:hypothetical protein
MNTVSCTKLLRERSQSGATGCTLRSIVSVLFNEALNCWVYVGVGDS